MKVTDIQVLFDIHYDQLNGNRQLAEQKLLENNPSSSQSLLNWAFWLWSVAEQVERFDDRLLLEKYHDKIQEGIDYLQENWR